MKKILLLIISIASFSCSNDDTQSDADTTNQIFQDKNYNNLFFIEATFEKLNIDGNQLPVYPGDAVTIFESTTNIKITASTFETNLISPVTYFKTGDTYYLPLNTQYSIYESSRIIIKKIEYNTSYGKDKRTERYSY